MESDSGRSNGRSSAVRRKEQRLRRIGAGLRAPLQRDSGSAWGRRETDDYNAWASLLAGALRRGWGYLETVSLTLLPSRLVVWADKD
jgi:hypothetical protein